MLGLSLVSPCGVTNKLSPKHLVRQRDECSITLFHPSRPEQQRTNICVPVQYSVGDHVTPHPRLQQAINKQCQASVQVVIFGLGVVTILPCRRTYQSSS